MQSITLGATTLFNVACDYLNDATQWDRIATLNQINDPWLTGLTTLTIPAALPNGGGAVDS